jgi:phage terminase large subunit-like protein
VFVENEKNSGVKPEKLSYAEKIDAISAIVNGWHRLLAQPRNLANEVYSKRGIVFL